MGSSKGVKMKLTLDRERYSGTLGFRRPRITAVIPARNEEKNLPLVLPKIPKIVDELILVDGLSSDRTNAVARELRPDIRIVKQDGRGKGNAIKCGIRAATGDIVVMLDADGSMDPDEIPRFVAPILEGYDLVKGSRFIPGAGTKDMEIYRKLGNRLFVLLLNLLFGGRTSDLCYGYMAFRRDAINRFDIESDGFEIETELNVKALKARFKIMEVPSFEEKRFSGTGNLRAFRDGKRILATMFSLRMKDRLRR
jgi:glycosyltransferase involved in cell wall biosynthesis